MTKTVTLYAPIGGRFGDCTAYLTREDAETFIYSNLNLYPHGWAIETVEYTVPDDAIWQGELVEVDLHRGGSYDLEEDSVHTGGKWYDAIPGIAEVGVVVMDRGEVHGRVVSYRGEHLQAVLLRVGHGGFPYRNLRRRDPNL